MRHSDADQTMATERYLLGEMSRPELDDFEEHMFVCTECAAAVKSGAAFTENARAVFHEHPDLYHGVAAGKKREADKEPSPFFRKWFSFPQMATSFAALALLCVVGYQQFVIIPGMRAPQSTVIYPVAAITRSAEASTVIPHGAQSFTIQMDSVSKKCLSGCTARVRDSQGTLGPATTLALSTDRTALIVLTRAAVKAGEYTVVVQTKGPGTEEVAQYPFRVE